MEHLTDVAELLYSISDPAYIIDEDGYVALANDAWLGRLGLGRDAVIGRHLKSVIWDYRFSRQCDDEAILPFAEDISADQELIALHALERGTGNGCLLPVGRSRQAHFRLPAARRRTAAGRICD